MNWLLQLFGKHVARHTVASHTTGGGVLDVRFGLALLRDRRIPVSSKLMALAAGGILTAIAVGCEFPLETLMALLLPLLGVISDAAIDGLEVVAGPLLIASLLLPYVAPAGVVTHIREERFGVPARMQA